MRLVRDRRKLTRPRAAELLHVSPDLLKKIERGETPCSPAVLDKMILAYELDRAQERHTRALTQPPVPLPSIAELHTRANTPDYRAKLDYLDNRGLIGAYVDPLCNVVLANERFRADLPGVERFGDNIATWFFHPGSPLPTAEPIVVQWDRAAVLIAASVRGSFGRHRDTPRALTLYQQLRRSTAFTRLWETNLSVAHGLKTQEPVHLRQPATGEHYTVRIHLGAQNSPELRFCFAYRDECDKPPH
ncbi:helix-turn-helix domain-containing protein [Nocardia sp. NPDC058176]|uniref:MmyB family transcriptional regulator n=1 Tax=Nocardia sp. NPDC058176 TaxID=3346368 RepID=UPI0036D781C7